MISSSSDTEIFGLLEKAGKARFDMQSAAVFDFDFDGDFYFFIFCPGTIFRGTFLFRIPLPEMQFQLRHELIPELLELPEKGEMIQLKNRALERVEILLSGRKLDAGYFDGH